MRILQSIAAGVLALCLGSALALAFDFPQLTGPVVDQADILTAASRSDIAAKSIALQEKSGIQLVVATVRSLEGSDIETYANQTVPHLAARPGAEEQRRAASGRARRA